MQGRTGNATKAQPGVSATGAHAVRVITSAEALLAVLSQLCEWADELRLAFAWAHSQHGSAAHWLALDLSKTSRAVIGTEFARTEPYVLERFNTLPGRLRVAINERGTFHPKVIVGIKRGQAKAILGSANFTGAAYSTNAELNVLLSGSTANAEIADLLAYIDGWWSKASEVDDAWIADYQKAFERAQRQAVIPIPRAALEITSISSLAMSWPDYLQRINGQEGREAGPDFKISVRGASPSYFEELNSAAALFAKEPRFDRLNRDQRFQLMGVGGNSNGLLGSMHAAGFAKGVAGRDPGEIGKTLDRLPLSGPVSLDTVRDLLNELTSIKGIKLGVATRLFAVKRPDLFVSVNNGSNPQLAKLVGGRPIKTVKHYLDLLRLVWDTEWHRAERPTDPADAAIWDRRAALLDAALYQVVQH